MASSAPSSSSSLSSTASAGAKKNARSAGSRKKTPKTNIYLIAAVRTDTEDFNREMCVSWNEEAPRQKDRDLKFRVMGWKAGPSGYRSKVWLVDC